MRCMRAVSWCSPGVRNRKPSSRRRTAGHGSLSAVTTRLGNLFCAIASSHGQGTSSGGRHAAARSTKPATSSKLPSWADSTTDNKPSSCSIASRTVSVTR